MPFESQPVLTEVPLGWGTTKEAMLMTALGVSYFFMLTASVCSSLMTLKHLLCINSALLEHFNPRNVQHSE